MTSDYFIKFESKSILQVSSLKIILISFLAT